MPNIDTPAPNSKRLTTGVFLLLCALLGLVVSVYHTGLKGSFLLDDDPNIQPAEIQELNLAALKGQLADGEMLFGLSRGVTRISFAMTLYFNGNEPYAFKYQNLLLHLINGLLVFWLIYLLAGRTSNQSNSAAPVWLALGVTTLWVLHPLHVSTVLYAVQRLALLSSLFLLCAVIAYTKGRLLSETRPYFGAAISLAGVSLFGTLGLLSKENAAVLPLLLLVVEGIFFRFRSRSTRHLTIFALVWLVVIALPLALGTVYIVLRLDSLLGWHAGRGFSGVERLMTQTHVIALYLKLFFIPIPGNMSLFHDAFPITRHLDSGTIILASLYTALCIFSVLLAKRAPWICFGILWFFACHVVESSILPLEMVFEHRNYLATLGLAALVVFGLVAVLSSINRTRLAVPVLIAVAALLGFNTSSRANAWSSLDSMLAVDYLNRPNSPRVLEALLTRESMRGNQAVAIALLQQLLALDTEDAAPELTFLLLFCNTPSMPETPYLHALEKLNGRLITPLVGTTLATFADHALNGQCEAITSKQLEALTLAALNNPRARGRDQRCLAGEVATRVLMAHSRWPEAESTFAITLDHCAKAKPVHMRFVIENLLRFASDMGVFQKTREMLRTITSDASRHEALDSAFLNQGGFNLDRIASATESP